MNIDCVPSNLQSDAHVLSDPIFIAPTCNSHPTITLPAAHLGKQTLKEGGNLLKVT